jgi:DNA repair exonuclease SbcCD ATPase subunit
MLLLILLLALPMAADDFEYVYVRPNIQRIHAGNTGLDKALAVKKRWNGDFLWLRQSGREYVIQDRATLTSIAALFAPMESLDPERKSIHKRLRPLERRARDLELQIDKLEDADRDASALRPEMRRLEAQMKVIEDEEERLDEKQERLEEEAEKKLRIVLTQAIRNGSAKSVN